MTRLVVEAVNSALTCVLLGQLVRYHLLNKKMALSAMVASDQVKKKRMVVKARIAVAFVFEAVILAVHPLPGIEMPHLSLSSEPRHQAKKACKCMLSRVMLAASCSNVSITVSTSGMPPPPSCSSSSR